MRDLKDIVMEMKAIAKDAGAFVRSEREHFDLDRVEVKGAHDYVSYVDKETERIIVERLRSLVPEAGFVTEEGTADALDAAQDSDLRWVIDPLDGTSNFVHGMAPYCVCIGLRNDDEVLAGVVYEVVGDEMFWSYKGGRSYMNDKVISVGRAEKVNDAFVCIGYPYDVTRWKPMVKALVDALYGNCISLRNLGSAQAEICYVACGRFDVYVESFVKAWDVTAGSIILQNAGGRISDYQGGREWESGMHVLATNGRVHDEMISLINKSNIL